VQSPPRSSNTETAPPQACAVNLQAINRIGAKAFIPHQTNHTGRSGGLWEKSVHFYKYHRDEFNAHYHKRSNVESSFSMVKAKFGGYVRSKTKRAQMNEVLCKVLCHNIYVVIQSIYELGITPEVLATRPSE
jgi:transposase